MFEKLFYNSGLKIKRCAVIYMKIMTFFVIIAIVVGGMLLGNEFGFTGGELFFGLILIIPVLSVVILLPTYVFLLFVHAFGELAESVMSIEYDTDYMQKKLKEIEDGRTRQS